MSILGHFRAAQRMIFRKRGLIGALYIANILFAIALTLPVNHFLRKIATSALAEEFADGFFLDHFFDFLMAAPGFVTTIGQVLLGAAGLYLLLNTFFAGGILEILDAAPRYQLREFISGCGAFFGRFFRLFLIAGLLILLGLIAFVLLIAGPLLALAGRLTPDRAFLVYIAIAALGLIALGLWGLIFDYAKIAIYTEDRRSAFSGLFRAVKFSAGNFFSAAGLFALNAGILFALFCLYFLIEHFIPNTTLLQTYILLGVQQIFIISRLWMKVSFFASQMHLYTYTPAAAETNALQDLFRTSNPDALSEGTV